MKCVGHKLCHNIIILLIKSYYVLQQCHDELRCQHEFFCWFQLCVTVDGPKWLEIFNGINYIIWLITIIIWVTSKINIKRE